jgi:uncharacterized iron-regulated membrane protein
MNAKRFHKQILILHRAIGITVGLFLVVISLSGSSIVFHEELDHLLNRSLWYVTPQSRQVTLDDMFAPVQSTQPNLPLWFIQAPKEPNESYVFNQKLPNEHRLQTFVNPYTGEILGSRIWERSLIGFMYTLHHDLFAGKVGQIIVGITGALLLLMTISGVILWRGWRRLTMGFKVRWQAPLALLSYDIHKTVGMLFSIFFSITAFTGVVIVIVHFLPMFNQIPEAKATPQTSPVALSELLQKADSAIPEGKTTFIEFSEHQPEKLTVRMKLPNQETGRFDLSTVELDRYSGAVLQATTVVEADPFFKFLIVIADLHFGTFGGLPTRIFYVFVGLAPTILFATGLTLWQQRRWAKARRQEIAKLDRFPVK